LLEMPAVPYRMVASTAEFLFAWRDGATHFAGTL
jgi:hypothetical protein